MIKVEAVTENWNQGPVTHSSSLCCLCHFLIIIYSQHATSVPIIHCEVNKLEHACTFIGEENPCQHFCWHIWSKLMCSVQIRHCVMWTSNLNGFTANIKCRQTMSSDCSMTRHGDTVKMIIPWDLNGGFTDRDELENAETNYWYPTIIKYTNLF